MTEYQKLRAEFAKAALPAMITYSCDMNIDTISKAMELPKDTPWSADLWHKYAAKESVKYADALLKELGTEDDSKIPYEPYCCDKFGDERAF